MHLKARIFTLFLMAVIGLPAFGVPVVAGLTDGSSQFNGISALPARHLLRYNASFFSTISTPQLLNSIAFNLRAGFGSIPVTLDRLDLNVSTLPATVGAMTLDTTFANNIGADNVQVLSSTNLVVGGGPTLDVGGEPYEYVINFTTPFLYTPGRDLVLDFRVGTTGLSAGQFPAFVANSSSPNQVGRVTNFSNPDAVNGSTFSGLTLVGAFNFGSVPELNGATSWLPFCLTSFGLLGLQRRRT